MEHPDFFKNGYHYYWCDTCCSYVKYPAIFISDGTVMLTLWQALEPASAIPFDRHHNIGLHHFALAVKDADTLEKLHWQLSDLDDVAIEFSPEALGQSNSRHMICTIPGGLRVEFFAAG